MRNTIATARMAFSLSLACALLCAPSMARPAAYKLSCRRASSLVAKEGAIVLNTSDATFERIVRDQSFCERGEQIMPAWVQATDIANCMIGYTCEEPVSGIA